MLTLPLFHCRTTLQSLYQSTENARVNNYYVGGLSHTWMSFYLAQLTDDCLIRNEWYVQLPFLQISICSWSRHNPTEALQSSLVQISVGFQRLKCW